MYIPNTPLPTIAPNPYPILDDLKHDNILVVNSGIDIPRAIKMPVPVSLRCHFVDKDSRQARLLK